MYNLEDDINKVLQKFPLLKYYDTEKTLRGEIELLTESGKFIDIFSVEIIIEKCFPNCFPKVLETGGKIPREVKRHVMPKTNYLCLVVWIEELLICKNGITLVWFMDKVLMPRLCEEFRVNNGEKYQKEYSHGFIEGTWEYMMKKMEIQEPSIALKFLEALANKKRPKGNSICFCGSGKYYHVCHKKQILFLQQFDNNQLTTLYKGLKENPYKGSNL